MVRVRIFALSRMELIVSIMVPQLLVAQPHVDGTFRDIDLDDIPVSHQSDSATGSGLGRDMPDRKTGRTATETTIRDQGALLT